MKNKKSAKRGIQDVSEEKYFFDSAVEEADYDLFLENDYEKIWKFAGLVPKSKSIDTMLEAGCGTGAFGMRLARLGYRVEGVDISNKLVRVANRTAEKKKISYRAKTGDILNMTDKTEKYDAVLCPAVLHHFTNLEPVINSLAKVLKKNGYLVIVEPNGSNPVVKFAEFIRKHVWPFSAMRDIATKNETMHSVKDYEEAMEKNGLKIDKLKFFEPDLKRGNYGCAMNLILFIKYGILQKVVNFFLPGRLGASLIIMRARKSGK